MTNSNWIEIQGQQYNFDNVITYCIDRQYKNLLNVFFDRSANYVPFKFATEQEARAEYDRITKILIGE